MTPDVPAWCREEAARLILKCEEGDIAAYIPTVAHALHAAYLRGIEEAAGKVDALAKDYRDAPCWTSEENARLDDKALACTVAAAAIRALARG